ATRVAEPTASRTPMTPKATSTRLPAPTPRTTAPELVASVETIEAAETRRPARRLAAEDPGPAVSSTFPPKDPCRPAFPAHHHPHRAAPPSYNSARPGAPQVRQGRGDGVARAAAA